MAENGRGVFFNAPYQGNGWWIVVGLVSLFMFSRALSHAWSKHKDGLPVDIRAVVFICIAFLGFFAFAMFQVITH
jgi:hypothetical protein